MKIILSPSKTATYQSHPSFDGSDILFKKQTKKLVAVIRKLSKKDLSKALSIKGDLLSQTYLAYKNFHKSERFPAFPCFNGLVYKQLHIKQYSVNQIDYIKTHIRILDALYGVLEPTTLIAPYRLDMKAKVGINLYQYWDITPYFEDDTIINLASNEFSSMIDGTMITIAFLQEKDGSYINQATYSKMARGQMLNFLITNTITNVADIKTFDEDGYRYNETLSTNDTITFTR